MAAQEGHGIITTIAGGAAPQQAEGRSAKSAPFGSITGIALATNGDLLVADHDRCMLFRIDGEGGVSRIGGNGFPQFSGDGGLAVNAGMCPFGVASMPDGTIVFSDKRNHRVRAIATSGVVSTLAGTGTFGSAGTGGLAAEAQLYEPEGISVDGEGRIYVADSRNHRLVQVERGGKLIHFAFRARALTSVRDPDGVNALDATVSGFSGLGSVCVNSQGTRVAVGDGSVVRLIEAGKVRRIAGGGNSRRWNGPALDQDLGAISGCSFRQDGSILITDSLLNLAGVIDAVDTAPNAAASMRLLAGVRAKAAFVGDGGFADDAYLNGPGLAIENRDRDILIADTDNFRVRVVKGPAPESIDTFAGNGGFGFSGDGGLAVNAEISFPAGLAEDLAGRVLIADQDNSRIRAVSRDYRIGTVAGTGAIEWSGDLSPESTSMGWPVRMVYDRDRAVLYVTEWWNGRIMAITEDRVYTLGTMFNPSGIALDSSGSLYIAGQVDAVDDGSGTIQKIILDSAGTTVIGTEDIAGGGEDEGDDVPAKSARLYDIGDMVFQNGRLVFGDYTAGLIRTLTPDGRITTMSDEVSSPNALAVDRGGNLYAGDWLQGIVYRIGPDGSAVPVAGHDCGEQYNDSGDGLPAAQACISPEGILISRLDGSLLIADSFEYRVRKVLTSAPTPPAVVERLELRGESRGGRVLREINIGPSLAQGISVPSMQFSATAEGAAWLSVSPRVGRTPGILEIVADPAELSPGTHHAVVRIEITGAVPPERLVRVVFQVAASRPPRLQLDESLRQLSFPYVQGSSARSRELTVTNGGGGTLRFRAIVAVDTPRGGGWLRIESSGHVSAGNSATVRVTAAPLGLAAGTYRGRLTLQNEDDPQDSVLLPVVMTISSNSRALVLSQTGMTFTGVEGGGLGAPQTFAVINIGRVDLNWTVETSVLGEVPKWLSAVAVGGGSEGSTLALPGANPSLITVRANVAGVPAGSHYGLIKVVAPGAVNSPQVITVFFDVRPPGSDIAVVAQPAEIVFETSAAQFDPSSQDILLYDSTGTRKGFQATASTEDGRGWLSVYPAAGTIEVDQAGRIAVQPRIGNLAAGVYRGSVTLQYSDGRTTRVRVSLVVASASGEMSLGTRSSRTLLTQSSETCDPTKLVVALVTLGTDFVLKARTSIGLVADIRDGCGTPFEAGSVWLKVVPSAASLSEEALAFKPVGKGRWDATWTTKDPSISYVLTLHAEDPKGSAKGERVVSGQLSDRRDSPLLQAESVRELITGESLVPVAPGSRIAVVGDRLSNGTASSTSAAWPTVLAGATVRVADIRVQLEAASDGRIHGIVPFSVGAEANQQVYIQRDLTYSDPVSIDVSSALPVVFLDELNRPRVLDSKGNMVSASNPAVPRESIVIECAGLGAVTPAIDAGTPFPASMPRTVVRPPEVTIGGQIAPLESATLSPSKQGMYLVRVTVPAQLAPEAEVIITSAGQPSKPVRISVRQ